MNQAESTPTAPIATCPLLEILDTLQNFDRRIDAVTCGMRELSAGVDALERNMTETFQVLTEQNRLILARVDQAVAQFAELERAIIGA